MQAIEYIENDNFVRKDSKFSHMVLRIVGLLLVISSLMMVPPIFIGMLYQDGDIAPFVDGFLVLFSMGSFLIYIFRKAKSELKIRTGFIVVGLSWLIIGFSGAIPLYLAKSLNLTLDAAIFASVS